MRNSLKQLLIEVDNEFIPNLSSRLAIDEYVDKIVSNSMVLPVYNNGILSAFISFYCNNYKEQTGYLTMIAVKSDYRNMGVAKLLIQYAIGFLQNIGFKYFRLEVGRQNEKAIALYKKLGFTVFKETAYSFFMERVLV